MYVLQGMACVQGVYKEWCVCKEYFGLPHSTCIIINASHYYIDRCLQGVACVHVFWFGRIATLHYMYNRAQVGTSAYTVDHRISEPSSEQVKQLSGPPLNFSISFLSELNQGRSQCFRICEGLILHTWSGACFGMGGVTTVTAERSFSFL